MPGATIGVVDHQHAIDLAQQFDRVPHDPIDPMPGREFRHPIRVATPDRADPGAVNRARLALIPVENP